MNDTTRIHVDLSTQNSQDTLTHIIQPDKNDVYETADYTCIKDTVSYVNSYTTNSYPFTTTPRCLICEELKDPAADVIEEGVAWLCPSCKSALKQVVDIVNG